MVGVPSTSGDMVEESFKCFTRRLRFWEDTRTKKKKNEKPQRIGIAPLQIASPRLRADLREVIYERQMSPLQLCAGQGGQGVGIDQLPAVV